MPAHCEVYAPCSGCVAVMQLSARLYRTMLSGVIVGGLVFGSVALLVTGQVNDTCYNCLKMFREKVKTKCDEAKSLRNHNPVYSSPSTSVSPPSGSPRET